MAGLIATLVTHPVDVVRARLTVQDQSNRTYRGVQRNLYVICIVCPSYSLKSMMILTVEPKTLLEHSQVKSYLSPSESLINLN